MPAADQHDHRPAHPHHGHVHEGDDALPIMHLELFRDRFWVSLILTVPILYQRPDPAMARLQGCRTRGST